MAPYVAAKHGLEGLSDVLRLEFAPLGVHVAVIEPGYVSTDMGGKLERDTQGTLRMLPEEGRSRYGPPAGRVGRVDQHTRPHRARIQTSSPIPSCTP